MQRGRPRTRAKLKSLQPRARTMSPPPQEDYEGNALLDKLASAIACHMQMPTRAGAGLAWVSVMSPDMLRRRFRLQLGLLITPQEADELQRMYDAG